MVACPAVRWQIAYDDAFQLVQGLVCLTVVLYEIVYAVRCVRVSVNEPVDIHEYCLLLVSHMIGHLMGVIVVQPHDESGEAVVLVEDVSELPA